MGQTPSKVFNAPSTFGGSPQSNNAAQAQPLAISQGPGFAPASASDQTQMQAAQPVTSMADPGNPFQQLNKIKNTLNPFQGMLQQ